LRRALAVVALVLLAAGCPRDRPRTDFDGAQAVEYIRMQVAFGPRVPGTEGHQRMGDWLVAHLSQLADTVIEQRWTHVTLAGDSLPMRNVIARFNPGAAQRVLYVAHWDTRPVAEKDPDPARRDEPIPGANDGGSGTAILLGVADVIARRPMAMGVDLLFVDGEDYGDFAGDMEDVLIGSRHFAQNPVDPGYRPAIGVVWDMVGQANLRIYQEGYSMQHAPEVVRRVWRVAADLGYSGTFIPQLHPDPGFRYVIDDHIPLLQAGMRVINVIDLDYPPHHTHEDTLDKISQRSLQIVGDVAVEVLRNY
jgi:glutaminyl-peptide cyclotransferase